MDTNLTALNLSPCIHKIKGSHFSHEVVEKTTGNTHRVKHILVNGQDCVTPPPFILHVYLFSPFPRLHLQLLDLISR